MSKKASILTGSILAILFLGVGVANAQTADQTVWSSTKGVQKVSNKQLFEDSSIKGSHIHAIVLSPSWNISKGVASINRAEAVGQANIAGGSSDWQISKGVQKIQRQKSTTPEKKYFNSEDQISGKN
ncbi:hypothetical protein WBG78_11660 [Chryseolinea sp. T2]|uniref:hypothetical protein n=1 Tax=Chryseolinea sp. T2 TaxID=3129255 RepID=UPI00307850BA